MTATKMKEKSIRLRDWEVRAILNGTKTRLSVPVKPQPKLTNYIPLEHADGTVGAIFSNATKIEHGIVVEKCWCPLGKVGDRLWVRETWKWFGRELAAGIEGGFQYRADLADDPKIFRSNHEAFRQAWKKKTVNKWQPSTTFPRWASRLTLEITDVRIERCSEISREDAIAEGIHPLPLQDAADPSAWWESGPGKHQARSPEESFRLLWRDINGDETWQSWVWAITFRRVEDLT